MKENKRYSIAVEGGNQEKNGVCSGELFLQNPPPYHPHHSFFPIYSQLNLLKRNANNNNNNKNNRVTTTTCIRNENLNDKKRRAILFTSFSILPFLKLKMSAQALQTLPPGSRIQRHKEYMSRRISQDSAELRALEKEENIEPTLHGNVSANPFLPLLNGLGIFGSGVLGALSVLAQKEKETIEATLESTKTKLKEKEATIISLQNNFEREMQNEKAERIKQLKRANEEKQSLMEQLQLAESSIHGLDNELGKEKKIVEELEGHIYSLTANYIKAGEDKEKLEKELKEKLNSVKALKEQINLLMLEVDDKEDNIIKLRSRLDAKELELRTMSSICVNAQNELACLNSDIKGLKGDFLKSESELVVKNALVDDLNAQVNSLLVERNEFDTKYDVTEKEYKELKLFSAERAVSDAKLLEERDHELQQLKEKLEFALNEVSRNKVLVSQLTEEMNYLKRSLNDEMGTIKNLEQELEITHDALAKSRIEASDLAEKLQESIIPCSQLESEMSVVQSESAATRELLETNLLEAKQSAEVLAGELMSTKEILNRTNEEMQIMSGELAAASEHCASSQKELVDVYKKAEIAALDLKEEKNIVTSLNQELTALESQRLKDKEARRSLEIDLEEATKSLDEMNRNASTLSRDLELANAQINSLEVEKNLLCKTLVEQKQLTQEAKENMKEVNNIVMGLGSEKEKMEKKAQKIAEEVASAKGEILRLKSQIISLKAPVNHVDEPKVVEEGSATPTAVPVVKTTRRKKVAAKVVEEENDTAVPVKRTTRRKKVAAKKDE